MVGRPDGPSRSKEKNRRRGAEKAQGAPASGPGSSEAPTSESGGETAPSSRMANTTQRSSRTRWRWKSKPRVNISSFLPAVSPERSITRSHPYRRFRFPLSFIYQFIHSSVQNYFLNMHHAHFHISLCPVSLNSCSILSSRPSQLSSVASTRFITHCWNPPFTCHKPAFGSICHQLGPGYSIRWASCLLGFSTHRSPISLWFCLVSFAANSSADRLQATYRSIVDIAHIHFTVYT